MAGPTKKYRLGGLEVARWDKEFNGKPSTSYSIKKSYFDKTSNSWKETGYFKGADLAQLAVLIHTAMNDQVNEKQNGTGFQAAQQQMGGQEVPQNDDMPF